MKKLLMLLVLFTSFTVNAFAKVWQVKMHYNPDGSISFYLQQNGFCSVAPPENATFINEVGLVVNGNYHEYLFGGSRFGNIASLPGSVVYEAEGTHSGFWYSTITIPFIAPGTVVSISVADNRNFNKCGELIDGSHTFVLPNPHPCGDDSTKVVLSHATNNNCQTLCVSTNSVSAHLAHGDLLGPCPAFKMAAPLEALAPAGIYPNPVKEVLHLSAEESFGKVQLFDQVGRKLLERVVEQQAQIDMRHLAPGVYFLKAEQRPEVITIVKD